MRGQQFGCGSVTVRLDAVVEPYLSILAARAYACAHREERPAKGRTSVCGDVCCWVDAPMCANGCPRFYKLFGEIKLEHCSAAPKGPSWCSFLGVCMCPGEKACAFQNYEKVTLSLLFIDSESNLATDAAAPRDGCGSERAASGSAWVTAPGTSLSSDAKQ